MAIVSFSLLRAVATERLPALLVLSASIGALRLTRVILRARLTSTSVEGASIGFRPIATTGKVFVQS